MRFDLRAEDQQRDVFAGMVGAGCGRIYAVVRHNHSKITWAHFRLDFGYRMVKSFQRVRVAARIVAVTVDHVELH